MRKIQVGDLTAQTALGMTSEMLWTAVLIAAPLIAATTLVAVLVSVLQVVTQVQESSLTFVPKLIVAVLVLLTLGGWMLSTLGQFATRLIGSIPSQF
jgi:flagellar biosynthesis protein FliQ